MSKYFLRSQVKKPIIEDDEDDEKLLLDLDVLSDEEDFNKKKKKTIGERVTQKIENKVRRTIDENLPKLKQKLIDRINSIDDIETLEKLQRGYNDICLNLKTKLDEKIRTRKPIKDIFWDFQ